MAAIGGMQELAQRNYFSFSRARKAQLVAPPVPVSSILPVQSAAQGFLAFMQKLETRTICLTAARQSMSAPIR